MIRKSILSLLFVLPYFSYAAGPPGTPQIYQLNGAQEDQVVMLSNWPSGKVFSEYEDYHKSTNEYFSEGQSVWVMCGEKETKNTIDKIHTSEGGMSITTLSLRYDPKCTEKPALLSNFKFPKKKWDSSGASVEEVSSIKRKLPKGKGIRVIKIRTNEKGIFFLVFDAAIPAIYDTGGFHLFDEKYNQVSKIDNAPLSPIIDLDGDTVPEYFFPSSDGMGAWIYKMYPKVDQEMSVYYIGLK